MNINEEIAKLDINAFLGVCLAVSVNSTLAFYVEEDEERMVCIDELIAESTDMETQVLEEYREKGVTSVVVLRAW